MKKLVRLFVKFLKKIIRCIIYPFRKPLFWVLLVLAGLYFFPILKYKVAYTDVFGWYKSRFYQIKEEKIKPTIKKGTDQLVYSEHTPEVVSVGRRSFGKASGTVKGVDVLRQQEEDVVEIEKIKENAEENVVQIQETKQKPASAEKQNNENKQKEKPLPEKEKKPTKLDITKGEYSGLDYLKEPILVEGKAKVINVNEIMVNDTYLFLYGIYSNPRTGIGVRGAVFLRSVLKGENVKCNILAHVVGDDTATAECFVGEESINQMLVNEGFSKRVSVK